MEGDKQTSVGDKRREIERENTKIAESNMQAVLLAQTVNDTTGAWEDPIQLPPLPEPTFEGKKITKIVPIQYYTQYIFFPALDGGIYGMGFGMILEALSEAANTLINQCLDANTLANLGGGFRAKSAKVPAGAQLVGTGEYVEVETNGMPLRDALLPFTFRGPSQTSFQLLDLLLSAMRDITMTQDIMMGDTAASASPTTTMIIREESTRVYTSIYKRIFRAMKEELRKLYALNSKYLPDESYFMVLDSAEAIRRDDYTYDETDVQPVADPTIATAAQRAIKAEVGLKFIGDPDFDSRKLKRNFLEAYDYPDIEGVMPEKQGPDPMMLQQMELAQEQLKKLKADIGKVHSAIILDLANAEKAEIGTQLEQYKAQMEILLGGVNGSQGNAGGVAQSPGNGTSAEGMAEAGGQLAGELGQGGNAGNEGQPV
jgi:chaperonin GroES